MGTRYFITVTCPKCGIEDDSAYYAPTCGFLTWKCACGKVVDLEKYTGISYEDASNRDELAALTESVIKKEQ